MNIIDEEDGEEVLRKSSDRVTRLEIQMYIEADQQIIIIPII